MATNDTLKIDIVTSADLTGFKDLQNALNAVNGQAIAATANIAKSATAVSNSVAQTASHVNQVSGQVKHQKDDWEKLTEFVKHLEQHMINHITHMRALGSAVQLVGVGFGFVIAAAAVLAELIFKISESQAAFREEVTKTEDELATTARTLEDMSQAVKTEADLTAMARAFRQEQTDINQKLTEFTRKANDVDIVTSSVLTLLNAIQNVALGQDKNSKVFTTTAGAQADALLTVIDKMRLIQAQQLGEAQSNLKFAESIGSTAHGVQTLTEVVAFLKKEQDGLDKSLPDYTERWSKLQLQLAAFAGVLRQVIDLTRQVEDFRTRVHEQAAVDLATGNEELTIRTKVTQKWWEIYNAAKNIRDENHKQKIDETEAIALANEAAAGEQKKLTVLRDQKTERKDLNALLREDANLLDAIRQQQSLVKGASFMGMDAKSTAELRLSITEIGQLKAEIAKLDQLKLGHLEPSELEQVNRSLQDARQRVKELQMEVLKLQHPLMAELQNWANSFGTTMQQLGKTIEQTVGTALQSLNQWIVTGKFNLQSLMQQIELLGLQLIEQIAIQRAVAAINHAADLAEAKVLGAGIATAMAPAAAAQTIATDGAAAAQAPFAVGAALSAIEGLFAAPSVAHEGGVVGSLPPFRGRSLATNERMVVTQVGERIVPKGGGAGVHIYAFTDLNALTKHMASRDGQKIIFDTVKGRRIDLGIR